jgi:hypothetical protein
MPYHPHREDWIALPQIPSRFREARLMQAVFFLSPIHAVVRFSAPRFVRQLIYFTQHQVVSRKRKAPSALRIDTPTIRFRS